MSKPIAVEEASCVVRWPVDLPIYLARVAVLIDFAGSRNEAQQLAEQHVIFWSDSWSEQHVRWREMKPREKLDHITYSTGDSYEGTDEVHNLKCVFKLDETVDKRIVRVQFKPTKRKDIRILALEDMLGWNKER